MCRQVTFHIKANLMSSFSVNVLHEAPFVIVELSGRLNAHSVSAFRNVVEELDADDERCIILNLSDLEFLDSAGLRVLLLLAKRLDKQGKKGFLTNVNAPVGTILDIGGFGALFHRSTSVEDAKARATENGISAKGPVAKSMPQSHLTLTIPDVYRAGYEKARLVDAAAAELYMKHTTLGDPAADAVIEEINQHPSELRDKWIYAGIESGESGLRDAPEIMRDFFAEMETVPDWFDPVASVAGCRGFHRHSEMFLAAFVGAVLIEGFSTQISKSFSITGRVVDQGVRRLTQNNRHLVEIFMPSGLERQSDGWKLSVRVRMVHAQVRYLLSKSDEWDSSWGTPLSAAHIAYATATFSALLLKRVGMLGIVLPKHEHGAFMMIWRYTGQLMGVMPDLLFTDEAAALHFYKIGTLCEPPPGLESQQLAHALINAAPEVAGIKSDLARKKLVRKIYKTSRALIGDEMADALAYPPSRTMGVLESIRLGNRFSHAMQRLIPPLARWRRIGQFQTMLDLSYIPGEGIGYRMPDWVYAEEDDAI